MHHAGGMIPYVCPGKNRSPAHPERPISHAEAQRHRGCLPAARRPAASRLAGLTWLSARMMMPMWHRHSCLCFGARWRTGRNACVTLGGLIGHNDRSVQPRRARGTVSTLRRQQTTRPAAAPCRRLNAAASSLHRRITAAQCRRLNAAARRRRSLRLPFSA